MNFNRETPNIDLNEKNTTIKSNTNCSYKCGFCKNIIDLDSHEPVRCKECGYRILYKLRSERPSEYLAR